MKPMPILTLSRAQSVLN